MIYLLLTKTVAKFSRVCILIVEVKNEYHNKLTSFLHVLHPSVFVLTETWLRYPCIQPPFDNYNAYHTPRPIYWGGGTCHIVN